MAGTLVDDRSIRREFVRYVLPSVAGMVVSSLYTMVDGMFVGRGVGELALGGVNIAFPFIMLVIAVTMLIAIGGANLAAFHRGRNQPDAANDVFRHSVLLLLVAGGLLSAGGLFFARDICLLLGADEALLPYAESYLFAMAPFVAVQTVGLGLGVFVRNDDSPNLVMVGTISGAVTNIVLDYLFIMVFGRGVVGAALATGIGLALELCVYLSHFIRRRGMLRLGAPRLSGLTFSRLLYNGAPSFLMEFCQSAVAISFNIVIINRLGPLGVAAYGIVTYVCSSFNMVLIGVTQGAQPILSLNHGRRNTRAVKKVRVIGSKAGLLASAAFIGACLLFGREMAALFAGDSEELIGLSVRMLGIFCLAYAPIGLSLMNITFFQTTECEGRSTVVSVLRCLGFVQVFLAILPSHWGEYGIYLSFVFGETANWLVSAFLYAGIAEPGEAQQLDAEAQPAYATVSASGRFRRASGRLHARDA